MLKNDLTEQNNITQSYFLVIIIVFFKEPILTRLNQNEKIEKSVLRWIGHV